MADLWQRRLVTRTAPVHTVAERGEVADADLGRLGHLAVLVRVTDQFRPGDLRLTALAGERSVVDEHGLPGSIGDVRLDGATLRWTRDGAAREQRLPPVRPKHRRG